MNGPWPRQLAEGLTFSQLHTFAIAAQTRSFAKTAEELGITQPAVSEQIKVLEGHLGSTLFHRRRGAAPELTSVGMQVLEYVDTILSAGKKLVEVCRDVTTPTPISISVAPFLRDLYIKPLLHRLYAEHPGLEIEFRDVLPTRDVVRLVQNGRIDLAIYSIPMGAELPEHATEICDLATYVVGPPGVSQALASGDTKLEDFKILFPLRRSLGQEWAQETLAQMGLPPSTPTVFVEYLDVLTEMVVAGGTIGVVMYYAVVDQLETGQLELLQMDLPPLRRVIIIRPDAELPVQIVRDVLYEALA